MNRIASTGGARLRYTVRGISAAVGLAVSLSACDGRVSTPTSPTPTAQTPTTTTAPTQTARVTYTLSGAVFEVTAAGPVPVQGVEIYCDTCGSPDGHTFVYTDADGLYSLAWAANGGHPLLVRKAGYAYAAGTLLDRIGRIIATVSGDTRLDIQLVRQ